MISKEESAGRLCTRAGFVGPYQPGNSQEGIVKGLDTRHARIERTLRGVSHRLDVFNNDALAGLQRLASDPGKPVE